MNNNGYAFIEMANKSFKIDGKIYRPFNNNFSLDANVDVERIQWEDENAEEIQEKYVDLDRYVKKIEQIQLKKKEEKDIFEIVSTKSVKVFKDIKNFFSAETLIMICFILFAISFLFLACYVIQKCYFCCY